MTKKNLLLQLIVAFILAYFITSYYFSGDRKFDQLAMGTETAPYQAVDKNKRLIHINRLDGGEETQFMNSYKTRGQKAVTLFLGNSQTHSINQKSATDVNFIKLLYDRLENDSSEILCYSMPNACLEEFCLSYMYLKDRLKIKSIVIPVCFDDLREEGIRDVFFQKVINDHFQIQDSVSANKIGQKINANLASFWTAVSDTKQKDTNKTVQVVEEKNILKETVQEGVENKLNAILANHLQAWNNRENVRGDFFVWLYQLRNTVLRIKASSIRKMIPGRYQANMDALQLMVDDCLKHNIKVLLYIPPIRSDVPLPYEIDAYKTFKNDIKNMSITNEGKVFFCDFDTIIPGPLWGYKESTNLLEKREVDYMHFKFKGHQILADSLNNYLKYIQ